MVLIINMEAALCGNSSLWRISGVIPERGEAFCAKATKLFTITAANRNP